MKFGLVPVNIGAQSAEMMIGLAQKAESVGLESVWTFEHVIVPLEYQSKYPYNENGKMGVPPEANFIDPLVALTAIACNTKTLRLGTGVNILSQTNPLLLAKQAASLDLISGGRFMLGVGIGWLREEFRAMGVPFERRGARFDDAIEAMKKVWSGEVVEHESEFLSWSGFKSYPVPVQKPHLPVVIGGSKGKAFERIAKYGDGWFVPTTGAEELGALLTQLDEACAREGRDRSTIEISTMFSSEGQGLDAVKRFEDAGVSRLIVPLFSLGGGSPMEGLDKLGNELIAKL
jgi:probable F420-dependent oxidoreductase